jgi:hypothetical protein
MTKEQQFEQIVREEFKQLLPTIIWQRDDNCYEVFDRYTIVAQKQGCIVYINEDEQGYFNSTRTAMSWCIADKYKQYNLARELLTIDNILTNVTNDIYVRVGVANKCKNPQLRENIETKLEPKILHKRTLELQLNKCVNRAKYLQQKGFANETHRLGSATANKTNR